MKSLAQHINEAFINEKFSSNWITEGHSVQTDFEEFSDKELLELEKEWSKGSPIKAINMIAKKLKNNNISGLNLSKDEEKKIDEIYDEALIQGKRGYVGIKTIYRIIKDSK